MAKDKMTEANEKGQADGSRCQDKIRNDSSGAYAISCLLPGGGDYNPPSDPEERERYKSGFQNGRNSKK